MDIIIMDKWNILHIELSTKKKKEKKESDE